MKRALLLLALLGTACADAGSDDAGAPASDTANAAADSQNRDWPASGPVDLRRTRGVDFDGDGQDEQIVVTARGTRYDSLDVTLTIVGPQRDTLWHEAWPSLIYFNYDRIEGKADSTVMRIVRGHVDDLLADEKVRMTGGLPDALRHADPMPIMRESVRYHLAELDWRRGADLSPVDRTPAEGYNRIDASQVPMERVDAAVAEIVRRPVFMYHAGGEATYAIGWSEREHAFVRIYSCC